jgi:large subunit ribosomal protein L14
MVSVGTELRCCDNSGAKVIKCIYIYRGVQTDAKLGDLMLIVVKTFRPKKKVKKRDLRKAVLIRKKGVTFRPNGITVRFKRNLALLVDKNKNLLGNRFKGPIPLELRFNKYMKIVSMARSII